MRIDVITVSTSRFERHGKVLTPADAEDLSGEVILKRIGGAGHIHTYTLLPDSIEPLRSRVKSQVQDGCEALVICGGTGLAPRDLTIEAVEPLYDKQIPGFGEIFRLRSLESVGTRAMLTRASAGIIGGVPVFCLPGSPSAASLGIDLILKELEHIISHTRES